MENPVGLTEENITKFYTPLGGLRLAMVFVSWGGARPSFLAVSMA
jgi:hypothetical protein